MKDILIDSNHLIEKNKNHDVITRRFHSSQTFFLIIRRLGRKTPNKTNLQNEVFLFERISLMIF
jgi:hypothetical protein